MLLTAVAPDPPRLIAPPEPPTPMAINLERHRRGQAPLRDTPPAKASIWQSVWPWWAIFVGAVILWVLEAAWIVMRTRR